MQSVVWQKNLKLRIDPDATRDFTLDFSRWLGDTEILESTLVTGTGITVVASGVNTDATGMSFRVKEATNGCTVKVAITTSTGQKDEWTLGFDVQEK